MKNLSKKLLVEKYKLSNQIYQPINLVMSKIIFVLLCITLCTTFVSAGPADSSSGEPMCRPPTPPRDIYSHGANSLRFERHSGIVPVTVDASMAHTFSCLRCRNCDAWNFEVRQPDVIVKKIR